MRSEAETRRPGRPLLGDEKLVRRSVMLTPTQLETLERLQKRHKLDSLSAALRAVLKEAFIP